MTTLTTPWEQVVARHLLSGEPLALDLGIGPSQLVFFATYEGYLRNVERWLERQGYALVRGPDGYRAVRREP